jgi:dTDP-4-dehydrorhamnose 3,5-epimerase
MINIDRKTPSVEDSRGSLVEFDSTNLEQVNILFSKKNTVRGNHYHTKLIELFYIIKGDLTLELTDVKSNEFSSIEIKTGDYFEVLPFTNHTLKFNEDTQILVGYNEKFDPADPDIYVL